MTSRRNVHVRDDDQSEPSCLSLADAVEALRHAAVVLAEMRPDDEGFTMTVGPCTHPATDPPVGL